MAARLLLVCHCVCWTARPTYREADRRGSLTPPPLVATGGGLNSAGNRERFARRYEQHLLEALVRGEHLQQLIHKRPERPVDGPWHGFFDAPTPPAHAVAVDRDGSDATPVVLAVRRGRTSCGGLGGEHGATPVSGGRG